ncbi:hypothetical protein [Motilimonas cestriensis]|uniref:hypothetical protein n=1 Tax=Motilimonas cestriensis TaxID=2742685 RepID=UPI003DA2F056
MKYFKSLLLLLLPLSISIKAGAGGAIENMVFADFREYQKHDAGLFHLYVMNDPAWPIETVSTGPDEVEVTLNSPAQFFPKVDVTIKYYPNQVINSEEELKSFALGYGKSVLGGFNAKALGGYEYVNRIFGDNTGLLLAFNQDNDKRNDRIGVVFMKTSTNRALVTFYKSHEEHANAALFNIGRTLATVEFLELQ